MHKPTPFISRLLWLCTAQKPDKAAWKAPRETRKVGGAAAVHRLREEPPLHCGGWGGSTQTHLTPQEPGFLRASRHRSCFLSQI